jgi:hypothetical protein
MIVIYVGMSQSFKRLTKIKLKVIQLLFLPHVCTRLCVCMFQVISFFAPVAVTEKTTGGNKTAVPPYLSIHISIYLSIYLSTYYVLLFSLFVLFLFPRPIYLITPPFISENGL